MGPYWISLLIQDTETSKPWVCVMSNGCASLEQAVKTVQANRQSYRVLSAWINTFDENNKKSTVFHECYVDVVGNVESPKEK